MRTVTGGWKDILNAFRMALDIRKMTFSLVAVAFSVFVAVAFLLLFVLLEDKLSDRPGWPGLMEKISMGDGTEAGNHINSFLHAHFHGNPFEGMSERGGVSGKIARWVNECPPASKAAAFIRAWIPRTAVGWSLLILCKLWFWLVWAYFGGAVTRIAAVEAARDERIELRRSARFAGRNYSAYFWGPVSAALGIFFFCLCIWLAGVALKVLFAIPFLGPVISGIALVLVFPLVLMAAVLALLLGLGLAFGFPLMPPAVSAEGTDAFDAVSRAFSYFFGRPWKYIGYRIVACLYLIPSVAIVFGFTCAFTHLAVSGLACGMGKGFAGTREVIDYLLGFFGVLGMGPWPETGLFAVTTGIALGIMLVLIFLYAVAFIPSYILSAHTVIYFLMRKRIDGTDMKEVYAEEEERPEWIPQESSPPPETQ